MTEDKEYLTTLHQVADMMHQDQGDIEMQEGFEFPETFENGEKVDWFRVTAFLDKLSEEDLATFAVGERMEMIRIANDGGEEGQYAYRGLDLLFYHIGC